MSGAGFLVPRWCLEENVCANAKSAACVSSNTDQFSGW